MLFIDLLFRYDKAKTKQNHSQNDKYQSFLFKGGNEAHYPCGEHLILEDVN